MHRMAKLKKDAEGQGYTTNSAPSRSAKAIVVPRKTPTKKGTKAAKFEDEEDEADEADEELTPIVTKTRASRGTKRSLANDAKKGSAPPSYEDKLTEDIEMEVFEPKAKKFKKASGNGVKEELGVPAEDDEGDDNEKALLHLGKQMAAEKKKPATAKMMAANKKENETDLVLAAAAAEIECAAFEDSMPFAFEDI